MELEVFDTRQPSDISLVSSIRLRSSIRVPLYLVMLHMASIQIDRKANKALSSNHTINICVSCESQIYRSCTRVMLLLANFKVSDTWRGYKPNAPLNHGFRAPNLVPAVSLTLRIVFRK